MRWAAAVNLCLTTMAELVYDYLMYSFHGVQDVGSVILGS